MNEKKPKKDEEIDVQPGRPCICGKSKTMPVCDGTHALGPEENEERVSIDEWLEDGEDTDVLKDI